MDFCSNVPDLGLQVRGTCHSQQHGVDACPRLNTVLLEALGNPCFRNAATDIVSSSGIREVSTCTAKDGVAGLGGNFVEHLIGYPGQGPLGNS